MADLLQLDWKALAKEANVRALLEDLIEYYKGVYKGQHLALAVWYGRAPQADEYDLLVLFTGPPMNKIVKPERQSLLWKTGLNQPPFVNIYAKSVEDFSGLLASDRESLRPYFEKPRILYFDKHALSTTGILEAFGVVTEPDGLIKGWYLSEDQFDKTQPVRSLLASHGQARPWVGIVKTSESSDFQTCRALIHVEVAERWVPPSPEGPEGLSAGGAEVGKRWLPASPEGITHRAYYSDWLGGHPGCFLFEGGAVYKILKFEVITAPEYSARVLEKPPDDRYPEVYLRAVYPPEQPAA
jgi:hypothetical protein